VFGLDAPVEPIAQSRLLPDVCKRALGWTRHPMKGGLECLKPHIPLSCQADTGQGAQSIGVAGHPDLSPPVLADCSRDLMLQVLKPTPETGRAGGS